MYPKPFCGFVVILAVVPVRVFIVRLAIFLKILSQKKVNLNRVS